MIDPVLIEPEAFYDDGSLRQALGLTAAALTAARRAGTLRHTRQGKRTLYKGEWILAWLETCSKPRQESQEPGQEADGRGVDR